MSIRKARESNVHKAQWKRRISRFLTGVHVVVSFLPGTGAAQSDSLALNKLSAKSSDTSSGRAAAAIDGNTSTYGQPLAADRKDDGIEWLTVDLGTAATFDESRERIGQYDSTALPSVSFLDSVYISDASGKKLTEDDTISNTMSDLLLHSLKEDGIMPNAYREIHSVRDTQLRTSWIGTLTGSFSEELPWPEAAGDFCLLLARKGRGELEMGGSIHAFLPGYYYLLEPGTRGRLTLSVDSSALAVCFTLHDDELERWILLMPKVGISEAAETEVLEQWVPALEQRSMDPHPLMPYRVDAGVKAVLLTLMQGPLPDNGPLANGTDGRSFASFPMADYVRNHYADKLTLDDMARHFGFHPHYIIKMFNQRIGMSPIQYLQEVRLQKAMEMLEQTQLTVSEISERLGWTTSYFSRLFHERKGMPPTQFRKKQERGVAKNGLLPMSYELKRSQQAERA
ncbi:helix-turn-helix domain-containing protein [Paenibacillus filicis]|uniref:Helix-turn-helix domain-containing protein n=1 Tax=Paenibacillus gyeongsangnamensis TaxID=3388067 RepID=A0ABT4QBY6_9BACL|nr:helix-turn-helix domain-containing protein [Paenibacillus filicis]MCZ8514195.1 helix-turn-helix domain-containing protein [Paenibacillus filicis]